VSTSKKNTVFSQGKDFNFIERTETFNVIVTDFIKNDAYCATEGLPYALIIGNTSENKLPAKVSILAICDNNVYKVGDTLKISPIKNPMKETSLKPIYFIKRDTIDGIITRNIIGSENPAIWGKVL
jgi:hypothetical protein